MRDVAELSASVSIKCTSCPASFIAFASSRNSSSGVRGSRTLCGYRREREFIIIRMYVEHSGGFDVASTGLLAGAQDQWDNLANCPTITDQSRWFALTRNCQPI